MRTLSKSRLISSLQCPKRVWLEVHEPDLRIDSENTQARFAEGHRVGEIAQRLYDPQGQGTEVDFREGGFGAAYRKTQELLTDDKPIFEAAFTADGALALADVMLPSRRSGKKGWTMVEVKSSTSIKDYHRDDIAIQTHIARAAGVNLQEVRLAHIDSSWVYQGDGNYQGLLVDHDLTAQAFARDGEVQDWIKTAHEVVNQTTEPLVFTGKQCNDPYPCGFIAYCTCQEPQAEHPIHWLPRLTAKKRDDLRMRDILDMKEVPDAELNDRQRDVKRATLSGKALVDRDALQAALAHFQPPLFFLDFETIQFAVPRWTGTRPYQQIPFQFSVQQVGRNGRLDEVGFLDLSGADPSEALSKALVQACGDSGPIFVYNQSFEKSRISELAGRFPALSRPLLALNSRIVDLLPMAQAHYYHPDQQGSWSIKQVLPTIAPDLRYDNLDGVQDGGGAQTAYLEAISPETTPARKAELERQLRAYCALDTLGTVRLWEYFRR